MREFDVVIEQDAEGWYVGSVPALPGCHSQAKSLDDLMARMHEAIGLWIEETGAPVETAAFIGIQRIKVAA